MTALITSKLGIAASGIVASAILWLAAKALPALVARKLAQQLKKLFDSKDPDFKEWLLATVIFAEKKFPDRGQGKQKMDFVLNLITMGASKYLTPDQANTLRLGFEEAVHRLHDTLNQAIKDNKPPMVEPA